MSEIHFENRDCMDAMKEFPDKFFDLAIVDPPYGDAMGGNPDRFGERFDRYKKPVERRGGTGGGWRNDIYGNRIVEWDIAPGDDYFKELFRVSQNQIIWGGNYFKLPPTRCFLIWRKLTISEGFTMAMAEYAWTSFNLNAKVFEAAPQAKGRFHPTQKPVELYKWILHNYAEPGDKILDTHVGSASSLIACYDMGFDAWGYEIDQDYFNKAKARLDDFMAQIRMPI